MENTLEVIGLNKNYEGFSLKDVNFTLQEDCITGFIGINGAGKTTTIRTILGLAGKDSGRIKLFGKDMDNNGQELKNRIGIVMDDGGFYDELTMDAMKKIIAPAYSKWSNADYKYYMNKFSLDPKQKISTLSKGMRMKFALTLALSHNADLLIMDEPTDGLDPLIRAEVLDMMAEYLKSGGKSVFFSTHITSDLDKLADVLILIHKGKIIFQREKDEILENCCIVKGDNKDLNEENKKLFLHLNKTDYGFTAITDRHHEVQKKMRGALIEKATIEDIMLGYIQN